MLLSLRCLQSWPLGTAKLVSQQEWTVLDSPPNLSSLLRGFDLAIAVHGVSFFECLKEGITTITFDALGHIKDDEWAALNGENIARLVESPEGITKEVNLMLQNPKENFSMGKRAKLQLANDGGRKIAYFIDDLMESRINDK